MSRDITLEDTTHILFTTRAFATGIPTTLAGTPVVSAYENDSVTQITAGITLGADHDSVAGLNLLTIVATAANGYESGKDYSLVITTGTVSSVSVVGEAVGEFTIGRSAAVVSNPTNYSAMVISAGGAVDSLTQGYLNTLVTETTAGRLAGNFSVWYDNGDADTTGVIDIPGSTEMICNAILDDTGSTGVVVADKTGYSLAATGLDAIVSTATGMVEIAKAIWDRVLTGATHNIATSAGRRLRTIQEFQGYEGGAVWIDTVNGTAGTTDYENGTVENPVDTIADANTILASVGLSRVELAPASTVTFAASQTGQIMKGHGATIALGGQDCDNSHFIDVDVSGTATAATEIEFHDCEIGTASLQKAHFFDCGFEATLTMTLAGDYEYINCYSLVAGASSPTFAKTAGQTITAQWRHWKGGITVSGLESGDVLTIGGSEMGTITLNGADATVEIRGIYKGLTNNLTGSPTVNIDGAILGADVAATLVDTAEIGAAGVGLTDVTLGANAHGGSGATLTVDQIRVDASNANGGIYVTNDSGDAVHYETSNSTSSGMKIVGSTIGAAFSVVANGVASALDLVGAVVGLNISASSSLGNGILVTPGATADGIKINGGATSGDAIHLVTTSGDGIDASTDITVGAGFLGGITGDLTGNVSGSVGSVTSEVSADTVKIAGNAEAATDLAASAKTIVTATVDTVTNTHTPTTTEFQADDVTEATADHYNGRVVLFTSGVLKDQATDIAGYLLVGGIGQFTVTSMTEAPSNNDTFIIV